MIFSFLKSAYEAIVISASSIITSANFTGISILVGGYILINVIAIVMNDRVNGSKTALAKLVFKEALWVAILNGLIWAGESYLCSCSSDEAFTNTIVLYYNYIYMGQIGLFIVLPILAIVANRNIFFKNILMLVTRIVGMLHSKKEINLIGCDDDNENTAKKSIIILPDNRERRKDK